MRVPGALSLTRGRVVFIALILFTVWMAWSLAQEIGLSHQLAHDANQLRQQNATLQSTNVDLKREIASVSSGASAEQDARQGGYARPGEKVYLVNPPPSNDDQQGPSQADTSANPLERLWNWFQGR